MGVAYSANLYHARVLGPNAVGTSSDVMAGVQNPKNPAKDTNGNPYEAPRHTGGNSFVFVDGHAKWLRLPGGTFTDGGPWVVPDMSMYSRTGQWEDKAVP